MAVSAVLLPVALLQRHLVVLAISSKYRFETLTASAGRRAYGKITKVAEHCKDLKFGPNARAP